MTVPNQPNPRTEATGNGVTTAFSFDFLCLKPFDLRVSVDEAVVDPSQYVVSGLGELQGGTVTFNVAPANGAPILMELAVIPERDEDYQDNGDLFAKTVNFDLDRLWLAIQAGLGNSRRALQLGLYDIDGSGSYRANENRIQDLADAEADGDAVNRRLAQALDDAVRQYAEWLAAAVSPGAGTGAFQQFGIGARIRTFQDKMRDVVSVLDWVDTPVDGVTSNQEGIELAVSVAKSRGADLYWPIGSGTYVSTANIPGFHEVRHTGRAMIKRGAHLFYVGARGGDVNTLHVDPAATAAGLDGLDPANPIKTMASAFAALKNWGPVLGGHWVLQLAPSSNYDFGIELEDLTVENVVTIQGPTVGHPNVPTAIVAPPVSAASGWLFPETRVLLRDIKFMRFKSNASAFGVGTRDGGQLFTENVHVDDCTLGVVGNGLCVLNVKGGIIERCKEGIRSLFGCYHSIGLQNAGTLAHGPIIRSNEVGLSARESSSGHCDWATFEDNMFAIDAQVNARVNCGGSDFKRNVVAIRSRGANVLAPRTGTAPCTFNEGTPDANGMNTRLHNFADDLGQFPYANTTAIITRDLAGVTLTGTTTPTTLKSQILIAGDYLALAGSTYLGKHIRMLVRGNLLGTGGIKNIRVLLGETLVSGIDSPAVAGRFELEIDIYFTNRSVQRSLARLSISGQQTIHGGSSTSVDMGVGGNIALSLQGTLANASDTIIVDFFQLDIDG
ncbi:hypothetical protein [Bordetella petrii]|uniref:hypothetical protein n=1 Tax=Bordetella petrii TaxID=94624 RepID=UPI0012DFA27E|nr:hypothetical protein [Bordetella petrii]